VQAGSSDCRFAVLSGAALLVDGAAVPRQLALHLLEIVSCMGDICIGSLEIAAWTCSRPLSLLKSSTRIS
jgi:hypothetical protein